MTEPAENGEKATFASRIQPAYQQVANQLRLAILRGDISPGERLPIESNLASMFGVSRSTVREALRVLSSERLVRTVRGVGGGSFVSQPDPGHFSDFLQTSIGLLTGTHQVSLQELIEARELLEVPAARFAAVRATAEGVTRLRAVAAAERASDTQNLGASRDFHFAILDIASNRLIAVMAGPVYSVLAQRYLRDDISMAVWRTLASDHESIVDAIAAADAEAAADLMRDHIRSVAKLYAEASAD